ncbi:hypothetical protein pb186bvf_018997 [Paramecium bursaria]
MIQLSQKISHTYYKLQYSDSYIYTATISNNLQFIVSGGSDNYLKIWDYQTYSRINSIKFNSKVFSLKFTDDSKILYVATKKHLYQLFVPNKFKQLYKQKIYFGFGVVFYCITNTTLLLSFRNGIIMRSNITSRKLQFQIQAHSQSICGLDYNRNLNIFASGSVDKSIKLWNGNEGSLIIEKCKAHNNVNFGSIAQVLFLSNNQLISLDHSQNMIIWDINFQKKELLYICRLADKAYNMSIVLDLYIITVGERFIKIYTKNGKPFKQFDSNFEIGIIQLCLISFYESSFDQRKQQQFINKQTIYGYANFTQVDNEYHVQQQQLKNNLDILQYLNNNSTNFPILFLFIQIFQMFKQIQIYKKTLQNAVYQMEQIENYGNDLIETATISNNLRYIVYGGNDCYLKIWDYQTFKRVRQIRLDGVILICRFTEDSKLLYVGTTMSFYQIYVHNKFKLLFKSELQEGNMNNIYCISNEILLTSFEYSRIITKTNALHRQQLFSIKAHDDSIKGLDYNKNLGLIVSGSYDGSIRLWNGNDGSWLLSEYHYESIKQVLFIRNNQLISLDNSQWVIIWDINYRDKQLAKHFIFADQARNISLAFNHQYIITVGIKFIQVYTIDGFLVRKFDHDKSEILYVKVGNYSYNHMFNTNQLDCMRALLIQGRYINYKYLYLVQLWVCKFY